MSDTIYQGAALIVPLIFAIVFHEVSHGLVARQLGDPTAQEQRRLSLNPLRHVDPIGTVILPGILALAKLPVFGWARPVPVDASRLRHPRSGMMLVAAAGPASNLVLAALSAVALGLIGRLAGDQAAPNALAAFVVLNLINFIAINVFLALFNLLPIPPFDGSHIVEGLLPASAARVYGSLRRGGMFVVIALLLILPQVIPGFDPVGRIVMPPVQWLLHKYYALAGLIAGG